MNQATEPRSSYERDTDRVALTVNGAELTVSTRHPHLLAALREELGLTSAKDGCSPQGQCGCCTVLVDGKAQVSCTMALTKAAGRSVTTLEGTDPSKVQQYAETFAACGALQCGFCTPGILMRSMTLVERKGASLTREETARHLGAHLCRCTGYVKILDAVEQLAHGTAATPSTGSATGAGTDGGIGGGIGTGIGGGIGTGIGGGIGGGIGDSPAKVDAVALATGARGYIDDLRVDAMVHGALVLTEHARADVLAIDTGAAASTPGVRRVLTAADIPGVLRTGLIHKDWPLMIPVGGRTSYLGDVLAVVVADDVETARRAATLVEVTYDVLTPIVDPVVALHPGSGDAVWGLDGNVLSTSAYVRGDVDAARARTVHQVHEVFHTQRIEQAFLEPESTLAVPTRTAGGGERHRHLHVYSGGQGVWDDRDSIAAILAVPTNAVTVELVSNGGAFGGKEDLSNQGHAALAAWLLDRPVKVTSTREQSLLMHAKRHPIRLDYEAGCDADGRLTFLRARMVGDSGPYASVGMKVLERAAGHASGPYRLDAIDVEAIATRTNNPVCGAFRGFGANQAQFAMEGVIDRLAELVGISGWEMRNRNVIRPGEVWGPGQIMDDGCAGAERCLEVVKPHYDAAVAAGKVVGLGLGLKNSGLGNGFKEVAKAVVRFRADGRVEVRHAWTEMGQGVHTVARQVAVSELGVDAGCIDVIVDTTRELGQGQTTGSRGTLMAAGSVQRACAAADAGGRQTDTDYEGEWRVDWTDSLHDGLPNPTIHAAFGYAAQLVIGNAATGAIEKVVAVHDVGRAVNPQLCAGQVEGSVHMGLGYALSEDFPSDTDGRPTTMTLRSLGILRPKDVPEIETILVEVSQPRSPYGVKGVGEIGLVPTSGAVAAMLHAFDGEWRNRLPMRRPATLGSDPE